MALIRPCKEPVFTSHEWKQEVSLFHFSWERAHQATQLPFALPVSTYDHQIATSIDSEVTSKFESVGKFPNTEPMKCCTIKFKL